MIRLALFFLLLLWAAFSDMRERIIPDRISIMIAAVSMMPPDGARFAGALVCLPLFLAGITIGGIGGGDIKLAGACGLVLGLPRAFVGLFAALCLLMVFHAVGKAYLKIRKREKGSGGAAYPLAPFLCIGMFIGSKILL